MSSAEPPSDVPDRFSVDFTGLTLLGIYRVEEKMAEGGMGSIYRGVDTNLDRSVVIKVPHVRFLGEPGFRGRFKLEINELVRLEHPGIVRILAQGEHEDVPFFILQFLGGGSLEEVLEQEEGPASVESVMRWLAPIARTLDFVHGRGTVHRDVKPANILFDEDGNVYLSDFGVAKALEHQQDAGLTAAGTGIGSPRYMAPEQAVGDDLDPTADQYALASMVYEALSGRPPFNEPSAIDLLVAKKSKEPEPLSELAPHVPQDKSDVVMKALSREPGDRYQNCREFLEAFRARPEPAAAAADSGSSKLWITALAVALLAVGAAWAFSGGGDEPTPEPTVTNKVGDLELRLLDAGSEPRVAYRYDLQDGAHERVLMKMSKTMSSIGNQEAPAWATPDIEWGLALRIGEQEDNSCFPLHWRTTKVAFLHHDEAPKQFRDAMERFQPMYETFACDVHMTPNGLARSAELLMPDDIPELIRRELTSLYWNVRNMSVPFPVEPIGVGARWEVTEIVDLVGLRLSHTTTYELQSIDEDGNLSFVAYAAQTAPRQLMNLPGFEKEMQATLASLHTTGTSRMVVDMAHANPSTLSYDMKMQMELELRGLGEDGTPGEMIEEQSGAMTFTLKADILREEAAKEVK